MSSEQRIKVVQEKIRAARTSIDIYKNDLKRYRKKLRDKGLSGIKVEEKLDSIEIKIEELAERERTLLRKAERRLSKIEERVAKNDDVHSGRVRSVRG